ncbi:glycosyltransferase family 4 protein [Rhodococcus sp. NBC_00297]|uniref:glycosyltransferase family 4 protein n=1 Tax=Rhodococcus sp. NBC_00297 TaxID=2976005 RepID=UPI002E2E0F6B|nr:glycosyltransferase family 4 protein [Rhodococcus sp. NBC_00297]
MGRDVNIVGNEKVAFVTESPSVWGAETSLLALLDGERNTFIVADNESPLHAVAFERGIDTVGHAFALNNTLTLSGGSEGSTFKTALVLVASRLPKFILSVARLVQILDTRQIVVAFSLWQALEVLVAAKIRRCRLVVDLHETIGGRLGRMVARRVCHSADLVIAPSQSIIDRFGIEHERTIVVPRPLEDIVVPSDSTRPDQDFSSSIVTAIIGQVVSHKRVDFLVDLFTDLKLVRTSLIVVGGEPDEKARSDFERYVRERADNSDRVQIIDRTDKVMELLSDIDVLFNISEHEAFGRTVAEAIACGTLPVCLAGDGPSEIVLRCGEGVILQDISFLKSFLLELDNGVYNDQLKPESREVRSYKAEVFAPSRIRRQYLDAVRGRVECGE